LPFAAGLALVAFTGIVYRDGLWSVPRWDHLVYLYEAAQFGTSAQLLAHAPAWNRSVSIGDHVEFRPLFHLMLGVEQEGTRVDEVSCAAGTLAPESLVGRWSERDGPAQIRPDGRGGLEAVGPRGARSPLVLRERVVLAEAWRLSGGLPRPPPRVLEGRDSVASVRPGRAASL
jgi:hypothetical protein